ncbi:PC-Esterase [Cynara cardunculus var. scolymus]|uniref:PC-Esterase n=1 Tax=Cynara cardunculus var. scolymus TaxID=59895 RepID=A0A103YMZ2_CYNCS|nr:PC-Esterase [Cynara cardunculus var. scolymus]
MADSTKYIPINERSLVSDLKLKNIFSFQTKKTRAFAYVFISVFVAVTFFLAFNPSPDPSSPWFSNIFTGTTIQPNGTTTTPSSARSQFSSIYSYFFPSQPSTVSSNGTIFRSQTMNPDSPNVIKDPPIVQNQTQSDGSNQTTTGSPPSQPSSNQTTSGSPPSHQTTIGSLPSQPGSNQTSKTVPSLASEAPKSVPNNATENMVKPSPNPHESMPTSLGKDAGSGPSQGNEDKGTANNDYNCTIELFVAPFLVQEWETKDKNGTKKETLRLDLISSSADQYKTADVVVFNTGHWWTHDKTAKGQDYYQEGSHVYHELNVLEAFRKAMTTWGMWVDANMNPTKTSVFFRGYSASHFSGGQWNSGGACDHEVEPIKNTTYLTPYPDKMVVLEKVFKGMKTQVSYMNITRQTDFRKDGHPSIYRKKQYTAAEIKSPLHYQDCSHWCLPGVPDTWNEILYAQLLVKQYQQNQHQKP